MKKGIWTALAIVALPVWRLRRAPWRRIRTSQYS